MSLYRNILVAHDGSADADAALRHAAALAGDQNARITLLTVAPHTAQPVGTTVSAPDLLGVHREILRAATDSLPRNVGVTSRLESGDPAATILRIAEEGGHDLIVMGSHGHGRVHRALIGSVSERVLRTSAVPVLLMRAGRSPDADAAA
ncbi:MAG: universal stress protein [Solirubrobacterales bacterium]